jgi:small GTP-binding protein
MSKAKLGPEEFKVVVLGDKGVGKTSLVMRYIEGYFSENQQSTVGAFFLTKKVTVKGKAMKMQLWDTAGQERFRYAILIRCGYASSLLFC